jgi:hypothetical protein
MSKSLLPTVGAALHASGIKASAHHMVIKSATRKAFGFTPDKDEIATIRSYIKAPTPANQGTALAGPTRELPSQVLRVTEFGKSGKALRVVIECQDPQTLKGESVCIGEREIAVQDVFQVRRCVPCQKRAARLLVAAKNSSLRARPGKS